MGRAVPISGAWAVSVGAWGNGLILPLHSVLGLCWVVGLGVICGSGLVISAGAPADFQTVSGGPSWKQKCGGGRGGAKEISRNIFALFLAVAGPLLPINTYSGSAFLPLSGVRLSLGRKFNPKKKSLWTQK